jgi:diacylglycerol kinase family enzyme
LITASKGNHIKVTLIHNPSAGADGRPSGAEILRLIRAAGHTVEYQSSKENKWTKALKEKADIIAVAGGDGIVGKVARRVIDSRIPVAVLPTGTANNIANTLGLTRQPLSDLIKGWETARCANFDAGVAKGPWGTRSFIEGFGVGLFAEAMFRIEDGDDDDLEKSEGSVEEIKSVLHILKNRLKKYLAKELTIRLDGRDVSGNYVLLEVLNIRFIGPNLDLVSRAKFNDGLFDVVFVQEGEKGIFSQCLTDHMKRQKSRSRLAVRQGRHLQIEWESSPVHIDDKPWPKKGKNRNTVRWSAIDIKIDPGALVFLTPLSK